MTHIALLLCAVFNRALALLWTDAQTQLLPLAHKTVRLQLSDIDVALSITIDRHGTPHVRLYNDHTCSDVTVTTTTHDIMRIVRTGDITDEMTVRIDGDAMVAKQLTNFVLHEKARLCHVLHAIRTTRVFAVCRSAYDCLRAEYSGHVANRMQTSDTHTQIKQTGNG